MRQEHRGGEKTFIRECLERLNTRTLRRLGKSRREVFETMDRPNALPLPKHAYEYAEWRKARVNIDYHTEVDHHYYSLACALGNFAARTGYTVLYLRAPRLFEILQQSRGDGSHLKTLTRMAKVQILIIDDFLLTPLADWERRDLLEIVGDRYQAGATVITSQCPIPNIGDPTLANAICDRLMHNAYRIELRGDSLRRNQKASNGGKLADEMNLS